MDVRNDPTAKPRQTLGEYRVGIDFNPGSHSLVAEIKRRCADLIDYVNDKIQANVSCPDQQCEIYRCKAIALTHFEEGCTSAVKAATKPPRM